MARAQQTLVILLNTHFIREGREAKGRGDFPESRS